MSSRVLVTDSRWRSLDDEPTRVIGAHQASSAPPSVISLDDTRRASMSEVPAASRPASPPRLDQGRGEVPPAVALGLVGLSIGRDGDGCGRRVLWTASGGVWAGTRGWTIDTGVRVGRLVHRARARRAPGPLAREGGRFPTSVSFLIYIRGIHDRLVYLHYPCIETSLAPPRRRAPLLVCPIRSARPLGIGAGGPQEATGLFCDRPCVRAPVISPAVAGSRGNLGGFSLTHHPCADRLESEGRCPRREALGPGR